MKIIGNILPFIGFKTLPVFEDGMPDMEKTLVFPKWESDCFILEWFGFGICLFTTEIRETRP